MTLLSNIKDIRNNYRTIRAMGQHHGDDKDVTWAFDWLINTIERLLDMEANRKESCDFNVRFLGEDWHIDMAWIQKNGDPAWYDGRITRDGVTFMRIFHPGEIAIPQIEGGNYQDTH